MTHNTWLKTATVSIIDIMLVLHTCTWTAWCLNRTSILSVSCSLLTWMLFTFLPMSPVVLISVLVTVLAVVLRFIFFNILIWQFTAVCWSFWLCATVFWIIFITACLVFLPSTFGLPVFMWWLCLLTVWTMMLPVWKTNKPATVKHEWMNECTNAKAFTSTIISL